MLQDPAGFMLVCTEHGVFAYDGRRFVNLGAEQGLRQGGFVYNIALTSQGRIAIGYADEVFVSDTPAAAFRSPESLSFQAVRHPGLAFYDDGLHRLASWHDGLVLLVGDATKRVVVAGSGAPRLEAMAYAPKEAASLRHAKAVLSAAGHLWESFDDGRVCAADPGMVRCYDASDGLRGGPWVDLVSDADGRILARSPTSVATLDPASNRWSVVDLPGQGGRYVNYRTRLGLFRTPDNRFMTQTDDGLAVLRGDGWHSLTVEDGAPAGTIVSAMTDMAGQLWFQMLGRGLVRWLGYGHWETLQKNDGLSDGIAWQTVRAPDGRLWVSTDTGTDEIVRQGASLHVARVLPGASFALAIGPGGALWRSFGDDGARLTDPATGRSTHVAVPPVNAIVAGPDDVAWLGTLGGLFKVEGHAPPWHPDIEKGPPEPVVSVVLDGAGGAYYIAAGRLRHRRSDGSDVLLGGAWPDGGFGPLALAMGRDHAMWVGGPGGLYRLVLSGDSVASYQQIPTSDTRTNSILAVMVDHRGWVWAGTALGVSVFNSQRWVSVDADSGLVSNDVDQLGLREDPDGSVWIVTSQGVSHLLDPDWLFADHPVTAFVSGEFVGNRPVLGHPLPYSREAFTFKFGTSSYGSEHSVLFRYRLSGVDADWAETQSGNVRYPFIPPGQHVLQVIAYDELTHRASTPVTLAVDLGYPWWRRWWSEILWVLCAAALVIGSRRLRFRRMLARQATLRRLVDQATQQLQHQAAHDSLTGLLNRSEIESQLALRLSSMTADRRISIALIDIDHFKSVNDLYGHLCGDDVLRRIGTLVRGLVRTHECAGRYGGEEILLILDDADRTGLDRVLALHAAVRAETTTTSAGETVSVTCSIGSASAVQGDSWESLIGRADDALYKAKAAGRDRVMESREPGSTRLVSEPDSRFAPDGSLRTRAPASGIESRARTLALAADLRRVDPDREMELFYQPIVSIQPPAGPRNDGPAVPAGDPAGDPAADRVIGYEALLRWHHPTRGLILPSEFVRLSEDNGSIDRLGAWILRRACTDAADWPSGLTVAINVSPLQFRSGELLARVREALSESGIPPNRVELEVTETTMLLDDDSSLFTLRQLRDLGVRIALDDFGTGFSSMSYLRWFQFDRLKIDRSFVSDICLHQEAASITRAILNLGRSLDIPVTAEGVETAEQVALLSAEGCTHAQGYLFGRPAPKTRLPFLVGADTL